MGRRTPVVNIGKVGRLVKWRTGNPRTACDRLQHVRGGIPWSGALNRSCGLLGPFLALLEGVQDRDRSRRLHLRPSPADRYGLGSAPSCGQEHGRGLDPAGALVDPDRGLGVDQEHAGAITMDESGLLRSSLEIRAWVAGMFRRWNPGPPLTWTVRRVSS
jgi:hypothetical protein